MSHNKNFKENLDFYRLLAILKEDNFVFVSHRVCTFILRRNCLAQYVISMNDVMVKSTTYPPTQRISLSHTHTAVNHKHDSEKSKHSDVLPRKQVYGIHEHYYCKMKFQEKFYPFCDDSELMVGFFDTSLNGNKNLDVLTKCEDRRIPSAGLN